ncbi:MAG: hypothetical protein ACMUHM_06075 [Thermoplasmatota archaeon]
MPPKRPSPLMMAAMIAVVLASLLMVISFFPNWASFDRSRSIGPVDYRLQANFDPVGFDYTMETTGMSGGSPLGGIGGGIAGNFSVSDRKTYPEVRGEFLDNIGIIYDSYRTKVYQFELKMRSPPQDSGVTWDGVGNPSAVLNISLEADLIPWWPRTGERTLKVNIELVEVDLWDEVGEAEHDTMFVQVTNVQIWAKTGYDKETGEYTGSDRKLGEKDKLMTFERIGVERTLEFSLAYPSDTDAAGFYVVVDGNMTDFWGRPELSPLSGKANPINIYPLSTGKLVQGFGIPLALPLMIISALLGIIAVVIGIVKGKMSLWLIIPASLLSVLAPFWFWLGMSAAVDLLSERLVGASEGLSYQAGIFISIAGSVVMLAALGMSIASVLISKKTASSIDKDIEGSEGPVFKKIDADMDRTEGTGAPHFRKLEPPKGD